MLIPAGLMRLAAAFVGAELGDRLTPRLCSTDEERLTEEVREGAPCFLDHRVGEILVAESGHPLRELACHHAPAGHRLVACVHGISWLRPCSLF